MEAIKQIQGKIKTDTDEEKILFQLYIKLFSNITCTSQTKNVPVIFVVIVYFLVERFFTYTEVTIKHDKNRIFMEELREEWEKKGKGRHRADSNH